MVPRPSRKEIEKCRRFALDGMVAAEQEFCCSQAETNEAYREMARVEAVFDWFLKETG